MPANGTDKAKGYEAVAQQKQERALTDAQRLWIEVALLKSRDAAKDFTDLRAQQTRDQIDDTIRAYGRMFLSLYSAVTAAAVDYMEILSMKDPPEPELGMAILEAALAAVVIVLPPLAAAPAAMKAANAAAEIVEEAKKMAEQAERIKQILEAGEAIGKAFQGGAAEDPNRGKALRMAMVRQFLTNLDTSMERIGLVFAQAQSIVTVWQYNPTKFNLGDRLDQSLGKMKLRLNASGVKANTSLFADFFLYDLLSAYTKQYVVFKYNSWAEGSPGGEHAYLNPDNPYFDKSHKVDGFSETAVETIYVRFGKNGKNFAALSGTKRYPIDKAIDFVRVWGAAFSRNGQVQTVENGKSVDKYKRGSS